jgi:hypothetical protein
VAHPSQELLAFDLICKDDTTLVTIGDAVRMISFFTPEQREEYYWRNAIYMLNTAIKEPSYITAATVTLQTALTLSGMLLLPEPH